QSANQSSARSGQGPGPGKRKTTQETNREEAEAQARSKAREAQAAADAAEKERQRKAAASAEAPQHSTQQAVDQTKLLEDERLRWKVSLCIGAAWIALSTFGWLGTSAKSWWHDFSWKWERDHAPQQQATPPPQTNNNYVPPYQVSPYENNRTNTSPFGPVGPPPTEQSNSPYSTLDSLNKPSSSSTQAPPTDTTSTAPSLSAPSLQQTTPNIFQSDPSTVRQRASDFLNNSGSSSQLNIPYTPHVMPTNTPIAPANDVSNSFSRTLEDINKKSGQQ
ncbi:MAG: hypothetical protein ACRD72_26540, partial [Candidatus Angelobacter sp.]